MRNLLLTLLFASTAFAERPNVLFVISDDQSYPHASAYGCKWVDTPGFDRVAKTGVLFNNAFAPTPGCSPTRACVLTGRHAWRNREAGTHASSFPADLQVFPEILAAAGYHVGQTGKGWGPGNFRTSGRKQNPAGPSYNKAKAKPPVGGIASNDYAGNFDAFLESRPDDAPFCFWFGAHEPHRGFAAFKDPTVKQLKAVRVPPYLPDTPEVQSDLLAYAREIEWFDSHLMKMVNRLEQLGELNNTLVIVTSDNGMAFPRAKANLYEDGIHMPLAISWPDQIPAGRSADDLVSLIDVMPTVLDASELDDKGKAIDGTSLLPLLRSSKSGVIEPARTAIFAARERHSSSRFHSLGYPQRAIRTGRFLYIRNYAPERWPAGTPRKFGNGNYPAGDPIVNQKLGPMHGGYHDIDACPTLTFMIANRATPEIGRTLALAVDKRPAQELFDIRSDPGCLRNLAAEPAHADTLKRLAARLTRELKTTGDPRENGSGDVFETYPRYSGIRVFPTPEWARQNPQRVPKQPWLDKRLKQKMQPKRKDR